MIQFPQRALSSHDTARATSRRGLNSSAGLLIKLRPQACKHTGNSFVQSFHERSSKCSSESTRGPTWIAVIPSKRVKWSMPTWLA